MKYLEKVDWKVLNDYIDNSLIVANKHPEYDIWILNYSPKAQSKKFWDEYTMSCRGMVIDNDGNILARPFQKFKNYQEHEPAEIDLTKPFVIYEKMDGSLIIVFYYALKMEWIVASRGSFISEQSIEAKKMLGLKYEKLQQGNTYLFEIIYPENRIVVDYGDRRELVLLSKIETKTGIELFHRHLVKFYSNIFTVVKVFDFKDIKNQNDLQALEETENEEGYVFRFADGFRFKWKFSEYVRLHGILTNVSNLTVWEHMKNDYDFDELLDRVPDEFYDWLQRTVKKIQSRYGDIERQALLEFVRIYHVNDIVDRGLFAEQAKLTDFSAILFKLYDKRDYSYIIYKMIRPVYSKPFKDGYEYVY